MTTTQPQRLADRGVDPELAGFSGRADYVDRLAWPCSDAPVHRYGPNSWTLARYGVGQGGGRDTQGFCAHRSGKTDG